MENNQPDPKSTLPESSEPVNQTIASARSDAAPLGISLMVRRPSASVYMPRRDVGGNEMFGAIVNWEASPGSSIRYVEFHPNYSSTDVPEVTADPITSSPWFYYSLNLLPQFLWVRLTMCDGTTTPWQYSGYNLNEFLAIPPELPSTPVPKPPELPAPAPERAPWYVRLWRWVCSIVDRYFGE